LEGNKINRRVAIIKGKFYHRKDRGGVQIEVGIFDNLKKAVNEYDAKEAVNWAKKVVEGNIDPIKALNALTEVIREVGDGFGGGIPCKLPCPSYSTKFHHQARRWRRVARRPI
jgi:hypothetical protein